jgi:hypothetical protein
MKRIGSLIGGLVACSVLLATVIDSAAQNAQQGMAKVVNIKGSARYLAGASSTWQPLKNGAILKPGSIIQTASGSYVDIILNNPDATGAPLSAMSATKSSAASAGAPPPSGTAFQPKAEQDAIRIFENTVLGIDKLTIDQTGADTVTETQLDLKAGSIFGTVKKLSAASKYEVKIPNGVAGIRGTIFFVTSDGLLRVLSGSVVLAYVGADGAVITQVVPAGQQFDSHSGQMSAMSVSTLAELQTLSGAFHFGSHVPPLLFINDQTLYYVSPTH